MKSGATIDSEESETERGPANAYEVLMPSPRSSTRPKKQQSPRPPCDDEMQKKIAKENRATNKKNLELMLNNKNKKLTKSTQSVLDKKCKKSRILNVPSESEEEQSDIECIDNEKANKLTSNINRRRMISDSESDVHDSPIKKCGNDESSPQLQQSKLNFKPQSNVTKEGENPKKRNSLLNYFNSVSREEAKKTAEQIKVKVHIHSPPSTPGRKPINQRSPPIDSPRRSARMRLSYEACDQIEVISSEIIPAPITPVKMSMKTNDVPRVGTPKRNPVRTPRKSPLKIKEKPDYVKNLKLKIRAPIKSQPTTDVPAEKFILSPDALDELFLSPNPDKKADKKLKKLKKRKKVHSVEYNDVDGSKSPRSIIEISEILPTKTNEARLVTTPKKKVVTPKNSPRVKMAVKAKPSPSKTSTSVIKTKGSVVTPTKRIVTPKNSPRTNNKVSELKDGPSSAKKSSKKINTTGSVETPRKITVTPKNSPRTKTAMSAVKDKSSFSTEKKSSKRKRPSESDASATNKAYPKTDSPARPPRNTSHGEKSPQVTKIIPVVKIDSPSTRSTKSVKGVSRKNGDTSTTGKSAFEEIMSSNKLNVSSLKVKVASANSVPENQKNKKSSRSTQAKKESTKSDGLKASKSVVEKVSETKQERDGKSPSKGVRKSSRESKRPRYEEIDEIVKHRPKKRKRKIESDDSDIDDDDVILVEEKSKRHQVQSVKPQLKLAPMFMKRTSNKLSEKVEDPAITEAKRRFLNSGVPECIKKIAEIHSQPEQEVLIFPTIAHVKQEDEFPKWTLSGAQLALLPEDSTPFAFQIPAMALGTLTNQKSAEISKQREPGLPQNIDSYRKVLNNIKLENPNYCVIRNYKRLKNKYVKCLPQPIAEKVVEKPSKRQKRVRNKKQAEVEVIEEPVTVAQEPSLAWTEKYKPMSGEDVVGNINEVNQLKTWLESWKRFHKSEDPNYDIIKRKRSKSGSSAEFIEDDDSREEDNSLMPINTSLVFGPCGSGKTSAVYAVAHELGFKVLEINASSKRTGKHLLKLQEATQSHRLVAKSEAAESIARMFAQSAKQKKKKKVVKDVPKPADDDEANNKMSLILIENADIIFEDEDEGFVAALVTLVQSSKRPVVIVANDSFCPHLSRFIEQSLVIEMDWPYPGHLIAWLQLVSLVEGVRISADAATRLVGRFNGDVARCLNQLQFWTMTGGNNLEIGADASSSSSKDDDSSDSMPITERVDERTPLHDKCIELFLGNTSHCFIPYPINLSEIWWNLAPLLSLPHPKSRRIAVEPCEKPRNPTERLNELFSEIDCAVEEENIFDRLKRKNRIVDTDVILPEEIIKPTEKKIVIEKWTSVCSQAEVDSLAMMMDCLAAADEMTSNSKTNGGAYDVELCARVWERKPSNGISARHDYSQCWHLEQEIAQSMAHFLADRSIGVCRDILGTSSGKYNVALPTQEDIRWRLEQQEADNTIVSLVPMNVLVDHRATFVDYLPMLQSVCRHENARLSTNTKRRNRFFHYLRGLGCHPSEEAVNVLCSTFDSGLWKSASSND